MNLTAYGLLILLAIVVILAWFASDMHFIIKSMQRRNRLSVEGNWKNLEQYFEQASKSSRLFVWLHNQYLLPGTLQIQHALFLYTQGRLPDALAKVDQAIGQIEAKPQIFRSIYHSRTLKILCGALRTRILILTGLGRYDEARAVAAKIPQQAGAGGQPNAALALLEYSCGRLDEALAIAREVPREDNMYDAMRVIMALAGSMKGEFAQAMQALEYEPSDISKFYSPADFKLVSSDPAGSNLIDLQRRKLAGVFQPARLLALAQVYLAQEEFENAARVLDHAEKSLGPEPGIQSSYCRYRACSLAGLGNAAETDTYIARLRTLLQTLPKRSLLWETHLYVGRAHLSLGRFSAALAELMEAERAVLHPLEKHSTAFWIARAHEAAGHQRESIPYYQAVAADPIPSRLRKKATEALARLN